MMTTLHEKLTDYLRLKEVTNFADIYRIMPEIEGIHDIKYSNNVIIWEGVSLIFTGAITKLLEDEFIILEPCHHSVYAESGRSSVLPIARDPDKKYDSPRWLPVLIKYNK